MARIRTRQAKPIDDLIDFDEGLEPVLFGSDPKPFLIQKRDIGNRYKSDGIDFDDGFETVDLRDEDPEEPAIEQVEKLSTRVDNSDPEGEEEQMATAKILNSAMTVNDFLDHEGEIPAVLTWENVRKGELPTFDGKCMVSGLPKSLENDVPPKFRYWKCANHQDALKVREALVESQIFSTETIRKVDGELRRAVAETVVKMYLPPAYDDAQSPEVPEQVRPVEKAASLLTAAQGDTPTTLFDQGVVEAVGLDSIMSKVGGLSGDWVICAKDSQENRKAIAGPTFQIKSRSDLIFATSADLEDSSSVEWVTGTPTEELLKFALSDEHSVRLIKSAEEERIVFGVVLEPDEVDSQNDTIPAEEIRKAAHTFMQEYGTLGIQHGENAGGKLAILESFIAPVEFEVSGEVVKAGSWLMKERVVDDGLWSQVKKGDLTGFSIGGSAIRRAVK